MRANVSEKIQVKAAGGVRTLAALLAVIDAGVTRCGATATAAILDEFEADEGRDASHGAESRYRFGHILASCWRQMHCEPQ